MQKARLKQAFTVVSFETSGFRRLSGRRSPDCHAGRSLKETNGPSHYINVLRWWPGASRSTRVYKREKKTTT